MRGWLAKLVWVVMLAGALLALAAPADAARIKELASVDGVRDNQLIGFGLVGGLAGTGDDPKNAPYTAEAIANMMATFGFEIEAATLKVKNFAAVMVTCDLPPYVNDGDRLDVTVSSVGSAKSLEGGQLYQALLRGADDRVYAVAQGVVSLGSAVGGGGTGGSGGMKTVGRVPQGALVENTVPSTILKAGGAIHLNLKAPDFTTANAIVDVINAVLVPGAAYAQDAGTVRVAIPLEFQGNLVPFISLIENLACEPGTVARVVINERTGTVVLGQDVTILPVVVTHGTMTLTFGERVEAPGLDASGNGQQGVGAAGTAETATEPAPVEYLHFPTTAEQVALGLNKMNLAASDIVAIFQAIDAAGALLGKLEIL